MAVVGAGETADTVCEFGTLSEIALALKAGKPVVGLNISHLLGAMAAETIERAASPEEAVERALQLARR